MKTILKVFHRKLVYISMETKRDEKGKEYTIAERYDYMVDDENNEPQILRIDPNNEMVLSKINGLKNHIYSPVYIVAEVYFYQNKPFKIIVIDILDEVEDIEATERILNKYVEQEETEQC